MAVGGGGVKGGGAAEIRISFSGWTWETTRLEGEDTSGAETTGGGATGDQETPPKKDEETMEAADGAATTRPQSQFRLTAT